MWILLFSLIASASASTIVTPTVKIDSAAVSFDDDLDFQSLNQGIDRQLKAYTHSISLNGTIQFGTQTYPQSVLKDSLVQFQASVNTAIHCLQSSPRETCLGQFNQDLKDHFDVYAPRTGNTKFTAYYSPDFYGSLTPTSRFTLPLYHNPGAALSSLYTREEIVFGLKLKDAQAEIAYVDGDLFDLYGLQVEGGGRIHLYDENGNETIRYLSFDGSNNKRLVFFSTLFQQDQLLSGGGLAYSNQHAYFSAHPALQQDFYSRSPNYVYFKISEEEPEGINSIPLTENRSLAFDKSFYGVSGIVSFIQVHAGTHDLNHFFLGQDVGSAITGEARADLYLGYGEPARLTAESLASSGKQYFLILK